MEDLKKMGPLADTHPMVNDESTCPACNKRFHAGDFVTLVSLGPGDDPEERARARAGRHFNGIALPVHWACATGEET